jgi:hypothetical protein
LTAAVAGQKSRKLERHSRIVRLRHDVLAPRAYDCVADRGIDLAWNVRDRTARNGLLRMVAYLPENVLQPRRRFSQIFVQIREEHGLRAP